MIDKLTIYLILMNSGDLSLGDSNCQEKDGGLEKRVSRLEKIIEDMEETWVARYGLIRRCTTPIVEHGIAQCTEETKMKPGTTCSLVCNSGYIATPGRSSTKCLENGWWSLELQCEEPLVVIAGGQISDDVHDSSIEVIDFTASKSKCRLNIPDMPVRDGTPRNLHSLIYHPSKSELLVCNGLTKKNEATCDSWNITARGGSWKPHSFPNKGSRLMNMMDEMNERSLMGLPAQNPDRKKGRYAAESHTINGHPVILGGMIYDENNHKPTETSRKLSWGGYEWKLANGLSQCTNLGMKRAFFCSVKVHEAGMINIGGFSVNEVVSNVTMRSCSSKSFMKPAYDRRNRFPNIPTPLSGHGCTMLPESYDILVAGGSRNEGDNARSNSYLYSWDKNEWAETGGISNARFGSRMVTVGDGVYILGGKEWNPEVYLNSIEQFDAKSKTWKMVERTLNKPRAHFGFALIPRSLFPDCA